MDGAKWGVGVGEGGKHGRAVFCRIVTNFSICLRHSNFYGIIRKYAQGAVYVLMFFKFVTNIVQS